jgi:hypothetical protein
MKKISLTPSVLQDSDSSQPRSGGPMLPSEVMHRQEEDHKRTREEMGTLEDGKMPVRLSHPQTVVRLGMAGQQNYARSRCRTTTVEPDQLDEKVAQVCWHLALSSFASIIVQYPTPSTGLARAMTRRRSVSGYTGC